MLLEHFCFLMTVWKIFSGSFGGILVDLLEKAGPGTCLIVANPLHIGQAGSNIEFDTCESCAILAAVSLFLHQEIHLVESPERGTVGFLVIIERFEKTNQPNATLVLDLVAHG